MNSPSLAVQDLCRALEQLSVIYALRSVALLLSSAAKMWLGSWAAALVCILMCCAAQEKPSKTEYVYTPDGQEIVINIYNHNSSNSTNNTSVINQPTSAPTTSPYSAPPANTPPSYPPAPPPLPPPSSPTPGLQSCGFAPPNAGVRVRARPRDCWVSFAGAQNRCNLVEHTIYKGVAVQTVPGVSADDCCVWCSTDSACNVFVYCPKSNGCNNANNATIPYQQCDLKNLPGLSAGGLIDSWASGPDVDFTSGSVSTHL